MYLKHRILTVIVWLFPEHFPNTFRTNLLLTRNVQLTKSAYLCGFLHHKSMFKLTKIFSGSSGGDSVQVQVLSSAPNKKDQSFDWSFLFGVYGCLRQPPAAAVFFACHPTLDESGRWLLHDRWNTVSKVSVIFKQQKGRSTDRPICCLM